MPYLRTLGDLHLNGGSGHLSSPRKELTLLAYLVRHEHGPVSRAELADLLWSGRDQGRARQSLRQALVELKRTLTDGLLIESERVSIVPNGLQVDVFEFEQDLAAGRCESAVRRWHGDFLTGCEDLGGESFRIWLEAEREGLRRRLAEALDRLVSEATARGAKDDAVEWGRFWVQWLPLEERGHRRLVESLAAAGRLEEAKARHEVFTQLLQRELGVEPSPEFQRLAASLDQKLRRSAPIRSPGSAALFTPDLVGRGRALAELREGWERARSGETTTILVEGEAGIGKTRLCEEFLRELAAAPNSPFVVQTRGFEPPRELELIQQMILALGSAPGLAAASSAALSQLAREVPALRDRFPQLPEPSGATPRLEDALADALSAVGEESPLVLYVDDFPSADPASRRILSSLMRRLKAPVLFLVTARTGEQEPATDYVELASRSGCRRLKLQLLRPNHVEELLGSMLELPSAVRHRLAHQLHDLASGNAFYITELIAAMVDEGILVADEAGTWQLAAGWDTRPLPLPQSLRDVIARRLARLSPEARLVANGAAVLGRSFDPALLQRVLETERSDGAPALEELIGRRLLRPVRETPESLEFIHDIIWRVTYDLMGPKERERLHRAAAAALGRRARWNAPTKSTYAYHRARAGRRLHRRLLVPALAAVAVLLVLVAVGLAVTSPAQRASLRVLVTRGRPMLQPRRILVAAPTDHTGDTTLTSLGALAADWIAQGLMRTTQFEVVDPRTAAITSRIVEGIPAILRDRNRALAMAKETRSGTVISGDLFRDGDSLRVLMQIIDVETGKLLRTVEPVLGSVSAPSQLVGLLGERVVTAVATALDTTSKGFAAAIGVPPSYEAYTEVSRAWEKFFEGDIPAVFEGLDRASAIDSGYMTPLLMRAYVETRLGDWIAVDTLVRRLEAHRSSLTRAERAVVDVLRADLEGDLWARLRASRELMRLTPGSVEGFTLTASSALFVNHPREALRTLEQVDADRGLLLVAPFYYINHTPALHRLGNLRAERRSAERGFQRFPDLSVTHLNLLFALAAQGDLESIRRSISRVTRDEPAGGEREKAWLVWRELRAHGHRDAAGQWLAGLGNRPTSTANDTTLEAALLEGDIAAARKNWSEAARLYTEALSQHPQEPTILGRLGVAAAHRGDRAEARRIDRVLAQLTTPYLFGRQTYGRARIAAALGDRAASVELLRKAWAEGRPITFDNLGYEDVHSDEEFDPLRDYPPFEMLIRTD